MSYLLVETFWTMAVGQGQNETTMAKRQRISDRDQADVLVKSRRRCCVCFGLDRDDERKKGQIAHLDGNPNNNAPDNLAFLCLDHHDEYDGTTSQAKNLTRGEVKRYRDELFAHFDDWRVRLTQSNLLSFLASTIDVPQMTDGAVRIASEIVWYGERLAYDVLVHKKTDYCDLDLLIPYLQVLDHFAAWGWLTYSVEERISESGEERTYVVVEHDPICQRIAEEIRKRMTSKGEDTSLLDQDDAMADAFADPPGELPNNGIESDE